MFIIGITGGIGSGKTFAGEICKEYGLTVIEADEISKQVTMSDGKAMPEIKEAFTGKVLNEDGSLSREAMSKIVFKDKKSLDVLSSIIHRHVIDEIKSKVEYYREKKEKAIVLDVPIPVKEGFLDICDQVWVISTDKEIRVERLKNRGMSEEEAQRRMRCQMTQEEYEELADIVIENNSDKEDFKKRINRILDRELNLRGIRIKR